MKGKSVYKGLVPPAESSNNQDRIMKDYPSPTIFSEEDVISFEIMQDSKVIASIFGVPKESMVTLYVDKEHRRKGFGRDLLEKYISECRRRRVGVVEFECHKDNSAALSLYKSFGFDLVGGGSFSCYICRLQL